MVYFSYYGNKTAMNSDMKKIAISRKVPEWAKVDGTEPILMPTADLLADYKNGIIDEATYTARFLDGLKSLNPDNIGQRYQDTLLLCYEASGEFCHRNLVKAWLNKAGIKAVEFGEGPAKIQKQPKVSFESWYTVEIVNKNKDKIYVFGDNLEKQGKGGQAIIRDCPNTFGIPTKRKPATTDDSYFSDQKEEIEAVKFALRELYVLMKGGYEIVFPKDGLGTGLAKMQEKSPLAFAEMQNILNEHFYSNVRGQMSLFD